MALDFTYAVARLRSIEAAMPDRDWFHKLIWEAKTGDMLLDLEEYSPEFKEIHDISEFELALEKDRENFLNLLDMLVPHPRIREFFRAGYDFDNLANAYKALRLGSRPTLVRFGLIDHELIERAVRGEARSFLPAHLKELLDRFKRDFKHAGALRAADIAGDRAKWRYLFSIAPCEFAEEYLRAKIDLVNIKNAIRLKRVQLHTLPLESLWFDGGDIKISQLQFMDDSGGEGLGELQQTVYGHICRIALEPGKPLWHIELLMRMKLLECIGESRYRFFDIAPIIYHTELREVNETLIRMIIVGLGNNIPEDDIIDRVNMLFPS